MIAEGTRGEIYKDGFVYLKIVRVKPSFCLNFLTHSHSEVLWKESSASFILLEITWV